MSQAGAITGGGGGGPVTPTTHVTDSGNAVPVANLINVVTGPPLSIDGLNGVQTTGAGNVLTIQFTNTLEGTGQTVGIGTDDLITFNLGGSATVYRFEFHVAGKDTILNQGMGYTVLATARTDGATATVIATPYIDHDEDPLLVGANIDFIASGNNVILRVFGPILGTTIDYKVKGTYVAV